MHEKQAFKSVNKQYFENVFSICEYMNHDCSIIWKFKIHIWSIFNDCLFWYH